MLRALPAGFLSALFIAAILTPVVRSLAWTWDIVDRPGPLKLHATPKAYLGGFALFWGLLAGIVVAQTVFPGVLKYAWALKFLIGGSFLMAVGLLDDIQKLSPYSRLIAQIVVGLLWTLTSQLPWPIAIVSILLFPIACNAMNLIDGMDGLAAGTAALFGAGSALIALRQGEMGLALLGLILCGACLGFLRFNWHPSTILMGDAGSLLLGSWIAGLIAYSFEKQPTALQLVSMALLFGFPLLDLGCTVIRRLLRGGPLFEGDRDHLYDVLARSGLGTERSVAICLGATALLAFGVYVWV
ncbi:MAG: hypothetical protein A2992_06955 [Elusimicrobia bacterium RIFCSPLOWO2_01_FULL_59_12]|nr:MAG: hypothetical protein A2992_06955 [Elusimicrobia bacterium RIFCSPLOWO2_01_FULL_59_12]